MIKGKTKAGDEVWYSTPDEDEEWVGSRVTLWAFGNCMGFEFETSEEGKAFYEALLKVKEVDDD